MMTIHPHTYHPEPEFFGRPRGDVFFGVELELDIDEYRKSCGCGDCKKAQQDATALADGLLNAPDRAFTYFKQDGSINGVEIVTHPASLSYQRTRWKGFFDELPSAFSAGPSCGLHVHCSKEPLPKETQWAVHHFIMAEADKPWLVKLAGRQFNAYARKIDKTLATLEVNMVGKYEAVNVLPKDTMELRLFASTTDFAVFMARLEFTAAIVHMAQKGIKLWPASVQDFASSHAEMYPNLVRHYVS